MEQKETVKIKRYCLLSDLQGNRVVCHGTLTKKGNTNLKFGVQQDDPVYLITYIHVEDRIVHHAWVTSSALADFPIGKDVEFEATISLYEGLSTRLGLGFTKIANVRKYKKAKKDVGCKGCRSLDSHFCLYHAEPAEDVRETTCNGEHYKRARS